MMNASTNPKVNNFKEKNCIHRTTCKSEANCETCHLFRTKDGHPRKRKKPASKRSPYKKRSESKVNESDFVNWNEDAIYC